MGLCGNLAQHIIITYQSNQASYIVLFLSHLLKSHLQASDKYLSSQNLHFSQQVYHSFAISCTSFTNHAKWCFQKEPYPRLKLNSRSSFLKEGLYDSCACIIAVGSCAQIVVTLLFIHYIYHITSIPSTRLTCSDSVRFVKVLSVSAHGPHSLKH